MKRISIIGGGISGLTVLHYLKQRPGLAATITLYERESLTGGTIRSRQENSCLFEWGPSGFLDNQPAVLELIEQLGLSGRLIEANPSSKQRYIQSQGELHEVSMNPLALAGTSLLGFGDKWALLTGLFKRNISKDNSIYNYVTQRFSPNIAESFIDPFISGVYAGNIKRLHMETVFSKMKHTRFKRPRMLSFQGGMQEIILELTRRYKSSIHTDKEITSIDPHDDITIIATPAYAAAKIVEDTNPFMVPLLNQIPYAPVAVVGLVFEKNSFKYAPDGLGYLVPSKEKKDVLGVMIESNIYSGRAQEGKIFLRVMLGGAHHPGIINDSEDMLIKKAIRELDDTYGVLTNPLESYAKLWPKAIPQYELDYPQTRHLLQEQCSKTPGLYLCANYLDGISFNDCINNAKTLANNINP